MVQPLVKNFEDGFQNLWELPTEDWAGIGAGVTILMTISAFWTFSGFVRHRKLSVSANGIPSLVLRLALISPWLALLAFCAKSGMVTAARLIAPYYPLLLPLLIIGAEQSVLIRRRWWRGLAWAVFIIAFFVVIVSPARPLWPAQTILAKAAARNPDSRLLTRALKTYAVYSHRADALADLRQYLPADLKVVGFIGMPDDLDISFWRPYGSRRVELISRKAPLEEFYARKVQYVVVSELVFNLSHESVDDWLVQSHAEVIASGTYTITVSTGPRRWFVVCFPNQPTPKKPGQTVSR
jgi:hypothetical protein